MYHISRTLYRDLARQLPEGSCRATQERMLRACELTVERLVTDPHYFAHPARSLFQEIRFLFPIAAQAEVWQVIDVYVTSMADELRRNPDLSHDLAGTKPRCQSTTRRGLPCQRDPLPGSRYCPSHQHLSVTDSALEEVTDDRSLAAALAA